MSAQTRLNRSSTGLGEGHYLFLELEGSTVSRLVTTLSILLLSAAASIQSYALQSGDDAGVNTVAAQLEAKYKACSSLFAYRESNAKLPLPTKDETRVVFIGNSITSDWVDH